MKWLALDIGGANLKAADGEGFTAIRPFALWRHPENLSDELSRLIDESPPCERIAVTMTGELADCFETKADGVRQILEAAADAADSRQLAVYQTSGRFATVEEALRQPLQVAAANWHALASLAGRLAPQGSSLLIDIGSTTTDVVPIAEGKPVPWGLTDIARLQCGELFYTGVQRSPVCAVVRHLPYRGQWCPVAQELFATTRDAYLILGELPEEPHDRETADGRLATRQQACARLARMICADATTFDFSDATAAAHAIRDRQEERLVDAVLKVTPRLAPPPSQVFLSGVGEFLGRRLVERLKLTATVISLRDRLGAEISRCAPAHALAVLAREEFDR